MSEQTTTSAKTIRPDDLLEGIGRSIMGKALFASVVIHLVVTGATSISLFRDWQTYGVKSPSAINAIRTEENRKAEEARRRAAAAAKAEAEAKAAAELKAEEAKKGTAAPTSAPTAEPSAAPAASEPAAAAPAAQPAAAPKVVPPEVQPLPPKKEFEYGDDLSLD